CMVDGLTDWQIGGSRDVGSADPTIRLSADPKLNYASGVRFRQQVPLAARFVRSGSPQHRIREILAKLDARLIQRIDVVEHRGVNRGALQKHEESAEMPCI